MRPVSIVGTGQIPVSKKYDEPLRQLGAKVVKMAMADAGIEKVDSLFAGNMLSDELQGQKHIAALIADEAGLRGIEALHIRAATATGAAAFRMAFIAVASGQANLAIAVGAEKMGNKSIATPTLAKALDASKEVASGANLISKNADLMREYIRRYQIPDDGFVNFAVNAHKNARNNPLALFDKRVNHKTVMKSKMLYDPLRLMDSSPLCDGAAAVVLAPSEEARAFTDAPVHVLASSVATDRFRIEDRNDPLELEAAQASANQAFRFANVNRGDISFFETHDAFSIMACLLLEALGFAQPGEGWRLAENKQIFLKGDIPISTMGGLKARGHPIGATPLYQVCESVSQLTESAGKNQIRNPKTAIMQSVGGVATTIITHILGN